MSDEDAFRGLPTRQGNAITASCADMQFVAVREEPCVHRVIGICLGYIEGRKGDARQFLLSGTCSA
jgi:hypothetical protein